MFNRDKFIQVGKKNLRIIAFACENFGQLGLNWQAVALSFFSTMSFIPLIAVIFSITDGFGLSETLNNLIYRYFSNQEAINTILEFAGNIIDTAEKGPYGIISFCIFIWLIIWLLLCVERCFNNIWFAEKTRVLWKRFLSYILILVFAPFIVIIFLFMAVAISDGLKELNLLDLPFFDMREIILWLIFYGVSTLIFASMFKFIPDAKVKFSSAIKAALIAAFAFTVIQFLYLETQIFVSRMNAVYGVFAAIPLFMVWVNIGWFIIIAGAQLSYSIQNIDQYHKEFHWSVLRKLHFLKRNR